MPILNWHNTRNDFIKEPNEQAINSIQFLFQSQRGRRSADWNFCIWLLILNRVRLVARLLSRRGNFGGHSSSWWVKIAKCIRACATVVSKETKSVFESNAFIFVWKSFFFPCFFFSSFFFFHESKPLSVRKDCFVTSIAFTRMHTYVTYTLHRMIELRAILRHSFAKGNWTKITIYWLGYEIIIYRAFRFHFSFLSLL